MDVGEGQSAQAITEDLSSPPSSLSDLSPQRSDPHPSNHNHHATSRDALGFGVSQPASKIGATPAHALAPATAASAPPDDGKPKRNSRAPVVMPDGTTRERKKPGPKPKPKDPNAPEKPKRKRQKVSDGPTSAPTPTPAPALAEAATPQHQQNYVPQPASLPPQHSGPRQSKITDLVNPVPTSQPRAVSEVYHHQSPAPPPQVSHLNSTPATPRPASSGQLFDPIRGEMSSRVSNPSYSPSSNHHQPAQQSRFAPSTSATSAPVSPMAKNLSNSYMVPQHSTASANLVPQRATATAPPPAAVTSKAADEMEVDRPTAVAKLETNSAGPSSNAPTPPPQKRAKEQPPPLPTGSGLLSGTPFGGIGAASSNGNGNGTTGTNIWLTFSLKGQQNVTINFAREVEKQYGFAALHPRLAARQERQRQLAAASNALEKAAGLGSADEMSLDLSEPESGNDGDAGGDEGSNAQPGDGTKKRRKRKAEDYDRNDEFIDDTEMAWEESALMARDGFFVYSGPLMAENEKPTLERADGTSKRGRGRGRGGAARGDAASGRGSRGGGTGGGRGSRGGATARKPRVTKADRAMMEQEKIDREKKAAALATNTTKTAPQQPSSVTQQALPPPPTLPSQPAYATPTPVLGA